MQFGSLKKIMIAGLSALALTSAAQAVPIYAIDHQTSNTLFQIDSSAPDTIISGTVVTGLQAGETLVGIDFRTNGVLYGVGSSSRVYTLNTTTGVATAVAGAFTPALTGVNYDIDFNPVVDLIRLVSDADQNLRISPTTGAVVGVDTALSYGNATNPNIAGVAYSNNVSGAATTTLYAIDSGTDTLNTIAAPNSGLITPTGPLGLNVTAVLGFDIVTLGGVNTAYAALQTSGSSLTGLYTINLVTGAATLIDAIGGDFVVRDIAVVPEPASLAVLGLAAAGVLGRRRRA